MRQETEKTKEFSVLNSIKAMRKFTNKVQLVLDCHSANQFEEIPQVVTYGGRLYTRDKWNKDFNEAILNEGIYDA